MIVNLSQLALHSEPAPTGVDGNSDISKQRKRTLMRRARSPSPDPRDIPNPHDIKWKDSDGRTLLHWAIIKNDAEEVEKLLSRRSEGLELEATVFGLTALHMAVGNLKRMPIVRKLLGVRANVLATTLSGQTVLHRAVMGASGEGKQGLEMVRLVADEFVAAGGDVSANDFDGRTALHMAVRHPENLDLVKALVDEYGADVFARAGPKAETPYSWAMRESEHLMYSDGDRNKENKYAKQFQEIADFLRKAEDKKRGYSLPF